MTRDLCFFFFNVAFVEQRLGGKKKNTELKKVVRNGHTH